MILYHLQQLSISWRYRMLKTTTTSGQFIDPHSTWESNGCFQYFLYSSFVFNTTATFLDMPLMKLTQKSFGIRTHSVTILTYSSRMPRGTVSCPVNFFFKGCHKFSIGLRSMDCTDHFQHLDAISFKPFSSDTWGMFWVIVLLECAFAHV